MGVATTTTEASVSAIQESLDQLNVMLGRIAARQDQMLVDLKKTTATLMPTATTTPAFVPERVPEQQTTKPSLPSTILVNRVVAAAALQADAVLAPSAPTRCLTVGSAVNVSSNHAIMAFSTSGMKHLRATTSATAWNNALQGVVGSGVNTSAGCSTHVCSTHVLSCSSTDPGTRALEIDTDIPDEVFTDVRGLSLFLEVDLDSADKVLNDSPLKDVVWDEEFADCVVTHIGGSSLFLEHVMVTNPKLEGMVNKGTCLDHGVCGVGLVVLVKLPKELKLLQSLSREMKQRGATCPTLLLAWDPGKQEVQTHDLCWQLSYDRKCAMLTLPWDPGACYSLKIVVRNLQYMFALIGNVEVVLNFTSLRTIGVEMESFSFQPGHSSIGRCQQLKKFGLADILEDALDTLIVVSLSSTCVSSRLFIWSTPSKEANAEWGIMIIRNSFGYEFYSNQ